MVATQKKISAGPFAKESRPMVSTGSAVTKPPRRSTKGKQRPGYQRRVKPPHSYAELITMAIKSSPTGMLTLRQILDHMAASYECFRGTYIGWKNSVRHNLSANDCFLKVLKNTQRPYGKDNFWALNATCPHCLGNARAAPSVSPLPQHRGTRTFQPVSHCSTAPQTPYYPRDAPHPYPFVPTGYSYGRPAPLSRWPSPEPGCTPGIEALAPTDQATDEWALLEDLIELEGDIDLALYSDGLTSTELTTSTSYLTSKYPESSPPPYQQPDGTYLAHRSQHVSFPHGMSEMHSPHRASTVTTSTTTIKTEFIPPTDRLQHRFSSPPPPYHASTITEWEPHCGQEQYHAGGCQLGSVVASAVRGSLSLDLDESALRAIERSVRVLDQTRPNDLMTWA